jgi:hypothetical protein
MTFEQAMMKMKLNVADLATFAREAPVSQIAEYVGYFDSCARTEHLVGLMAMAGSARRVLSIFSEIGNMCDAPWPRRSILADLLRGARANVELFEVLGLAEWTWLEALPPIIAVYRGCQRGRERGLSWTTERAVAEGFAKGKRCINADPTLVSAQIPKQHIFAVFLIREESEIILDPRRLREINSIAA